MTSEQIKTFIFGKTENGDRYTFRQWLVIVWAALSLAFLCMVEDAPLWFWPLAIGNLWLAFRQLDRLPLPADPEENDHFLDEPEESEKA